MDKSEKMISNSWHPIFQDLLEEHLGLMSGKRVIRRSREVSQNIYLDFICETDPGAPDPFPDVKGIRPFDHLKEVNTFEYKSRHETLNDRMFRDYAGRAIQYESRHPSSTRENFTANIIISKPPIKLFSQGGYEFKRLKPWKYLCTSFPYLKIYIIILTEMLNIEGGDPLAFLQILNPNLPTKPEEIAALTDQELRFHQQIMQTLCKLHKETDMTLEDYIKAKLAYDDRRKIGAQMLKDNIPKEFIEKYVITMEMLEEPEGSRFY